MIVVAHVCMSATQRLEALTNLSQKSITKLFRDLRDTHAHSTELERTSACGFGVGVSHILRAQYFADSNTLGSNLCLQPEKSHVQMTEALQTLLHATPTAPVLSERNGCSHAVHKSKTDFGCTSLHSWLLCRRCTRLHMMIERSPTVFEYHAEQGSIQHNHPRRHGLARRSISCPIAVGKHCQRYARSVLYLQL